MTTKKRLSSKKSERPTFKVGTLNIRLDSDTARFKTLCGWLDKYVKLRLTWGRYIYLASTVGATEPIGIFRNKKGIIPGRWGFYILGFEVGSRNPGDPVGVWLKEHGYWPW